MYLGINKHFKPTKSTTIFSYITGWCNTNWFNTKNTVSSKVWYLHWSGKSVRTKCVSNIFLIFYQRLFSHENVRWWIFPKLWYVSTITRQFSAILLLIMNWRLGTSNLWCLFLIGWTTLPIICMESSVIEGGFLTSALVWISAVTFIHNIFLCMKHPTELTVVWCKLDFIIIFIH